MTGKPLSVPSVPRCTIAAEASRWVPMYVPDLISNPLTGSDKTYKHQIIWILKRKKVQTNNLYFLSLQLFDPTNDLQNITIRTPFKEYRHSIRLQKIQVQNYRLVKNRYKKNFSSKISVSWQKHRIRRSKK